MPLRRATSTFSTTSYPVLAWLGHRGPCLELAAAVLGRGSTVSEWRWTSGTGVCARGGAFDEAATEGFPAVKWARPSQLRNRIVRGYWSIDLPILHTTATDQLPGFTQQLREVPARLRAEEA